MRADYLDYLKKYLPSERLEEGIKLLEQGVSPQYIVGNVDFYGNLIRVNPNVLIPRFETELLVEKTILYIKNIFQNQRLDQLDILDIGTGSGCIAVTLKKELSSRVTGIDISKEALKVAKENAFFHQVDVVFFESDIYSKVQGNFDVIISNPPYICVNEEIEDIVRKNEPYLALYAEENGLYFYHQILKEASKYLKDKFLIAFEIGQLQGEAVRSLVFQYLNDVDVFVEKDYSNRDRFVFIISKV